MVVRDPCSEKSVADRPGRRLTRVDPFVSSISMGTSIRTGLLPKGCDSLRKAIAFGIALVLTSVVSNQVDASPLFDPQEHAALCDCGPKCRQDRCCCRQARQDPQVESTDRSGESDEEKTAAAAKIVCQIRSRCAIPADSTSPSKFRSLSEPSWISWEGFDLKDQSAYWIVTDAFFVVSPDPNRIERPPRVSIFV